MEASRISAMALTGSAGRGSWRSTSATAEAMAASTPCCASHSAIFGAQFRARRRSKCHAASGCLHTHSAWPVSSAVNQLKTNFGPKATQNLNSGTGRHRLAATQTQARSIIGACRHVPVATRRTSQLTHASRRPHSHATTRSRERRTLTRTVRYLAQPGQLPASAPRPCLRPGPRPTPYRTQQSTEHSDPRCWLVGSPAQPPRTACIASSRPRRCCTAACAAARLHAQSHAHTHTHTHTHALTRLISP